MADPASPTPAPATPPTPPMPPAVTPAPATPAATSASPETFTKAQADRAAHPAPVVPRPSAPVPAVNANPQVPVVGPMPMVKVRNKLSQRIDFHIHTLQGTTERIRLGPQQTSKPVRADMLSHYTDGLVQRGHLRLIPTLPAE